MSSGNGTSHSSTPLDGTGTPSHDDATRDLGLDLDVLEELSVDAPDPIDDERPDPTLAERWTALPVALRGLLVAAAVAAVTFTAYNLPGSGPFLEDKAPTGIVAFGVITGTVTALLAMGLILIYRTNRFINFAYGAMGSFAGVFALGLHVEHGLNYFLALPIGVAVGVALGAAVDRLVRRFQGSSRLILAVASIGLAQILGVLELLVSVNLLGFTALVSGFETVPWSISLDAKTLFGDEIIIMLAVPPVLAFLAWFLLRTDAGIGVRAAAENADRALLLGIPINKLSTIVWMIAGGIAALTFILKAPFAGVTPGALGGGTILLLPALAAAVVARMESLPLAFGAGIGLGIVEQVVRFNSTTTPTLQNMVFLFIILAALLIQRGALSRAMLGVTSTWSAVGALKPIPEELRGLPEVKWTKRGLLAGISLLFIVVPSTWGPTNQFLASVGMVWAMGAIALVVLVGWGGHISLGQFAIIGVGGLVAGNVVSNHNLDVFLVLILAGLGGAAVSLLVGLPALRIQGLFLAVTTLAFAVALDSYVINENNFPSILPSLVERPLVWERFDLNDQYNMYLFSLAFVALAILATQGLRKARGGRVIIGTRDNQRAADSAAVPTTGIKLAAFLVAGVISGVAGGLHALILPTIEPGLYQPTDSLLLFSTAVIGGLGSVAGALVGVLLFYFLGTVTALGDIRPLLSGGVLLVVLLFLPGGIGQLLYGLRDRLLRRVAERRGILVPSLVADKRDDGSAAKDESGLLAGALSDDPPSPAPDADREPVGASR